MRDSALPRTGIQDGSPVAGGVNALSSEKAVLSACAKNGWMHTSPSSSRRVISHVPSLRVAPVSFSRVNVSQSFA
ncbi:hypothetical protein [uncultured Butyricimonas sp.]|uniref:hypothetical protein n=1 Tax=uncultured Butyricimonas sp. TaxID=1268785 RepID=UPI00259326D9|nr:hypothetical protein [uncultured Butyricimonas sp.]